MLRLIIFGSGRGSNFISIANAIKDQEIPATIVKVIVNEPEADMIQKAQERNLDVSIIPHYDLDRGQYEKRILEILKLLDFDLICLAGYMRILSANFIRTVKVPILNIHPSLLPSFPGLHAQEQALNYGVKITGCTVHLVNEEVDAGQILAQRAVEVKSDDSLEQLTERILRQEHELYPEVINQIAQGDLIL